MSNFTRRLKDPLIALFAAGLLSSPVSAEYTFDLPDADLFAVLYGDFYSYSGPILQAQFDAGVHGPNDSTYNGGAFEFDDTIAGKVDDELNVLSSSGGNSQEIKKQPDGAENAFAPVQGTNDSSPYFTTYTSTAQIDPTDNPDNGATQIADDLDAWDVNLQTFINAYDQGDGTLSDAVLVFNNNETDSADSQTLSSWFQVFIWDSTGTEEAIVFTFQNNCPPGAFCLNGGEISVSDGGIVGPLALKDPTAFSEPKATSTYPDPVTTSDNPEKEDFVISGGDVCFEGKDADGAGVIGGVLIDCTTASPADDTIIPHNLGADRISYMLWSPELNDLLQDFLTNGLGGYDMLSVDLRLGCYDGTEANASCEPLEIITNGAERAFWASASIPGEDGRIPEPSVIALMGIGLLTFFATGRRRRMVC